jgi:hypothetical protein
MCMRESERGLGAVVVSDGGGPDRGLVRCPSQRGDISRVFQVSIPARGAEANENAAAAAGTGPDRYKEQYLRRSQGGVSSSPHLWARQDRRGSQPALRSARQILWPAWGQDHRLRSRWPALVRHATRLID